MWFTFKFINSYLILIQLLKKYSLNIFVITDKYNTTIIRIIGIAILLLMKMINFVVCINKNKTISKHYRIICCHLYSIVLYHKYSSTFSCIITKKITCSWYKNVLANSLLFWNARLRP